MRMSSMFAGEDARSPSGGGRSGGVAIRFLFVLAAVAALSAFAEPFRITRGEKWIPVKVESRVAPGSALDLTAAAGPVEPTGARGRVVARGRHFEFEGRPGERARFYGVNFCNTASFPKKEDAGRFVAETRRRGYNTIRIHHHDGELVEGAADGTTITGWKLDRLDAFLAACASNGVYVTTDLFVSRKIPRRVVGQDRDGFVGMDEFKSLVLVNEEAYSNLCAFARQWMSHVNPYTGKRWADDPTLAFLSLVNEGHVGVDGMETLRDIPGFAEAWAEWAPRDGCGYAEIPAGVPWLKTPEMAAAARFVAELEMRFARRMTAFLRDELGVKALLTDMNAGMEREEFRPVRAECYDYVDEHYYYDHPSWPEKAWSLPAKSRCDNPVKTMARGGWRLSKYSGVGLADKPFVMTEYSFAGPGPYRLMSGLYVGAEAAREDWGGAWRFDWAGSPWAMEHQGEVKSGFFGLAGDVLLQAADRAAAMLFLRGDMDGGKIESDGEAGTYSVVTERTVGGFSETGRIEAGPLGAACEAEPTVVWATAVDARPLAESARVLVSHLTDLCNEGDEYDDSSRQVLRSWGRPPHLVRAGRAKIALALGEGEFAVYALDTAGRRVREVSHRITSRGRLAFEADVAADPGNATFLYEIVRISRQAK